MCKYRLYHKVEVFMWFTQWESQAQGCVNHMETDTEWYHWLVPYTIGSVVLTIHPWPSNHSIAHKRLECVYSNSAHHRSRVLSIKSHGRLTTTSWRRFLPNSSIINYISWTLRTTVLSSLCRKGRPHSHCINFNSRKPATAAILSTAD